MVQEDHKGIDRGDAAGIWLVRHGHYDRHTSDRDGGLSWRGRAQGSVLATRLRGHQFQTLYTSPRRRCRETAQILGAVLNLQPVVDDRLCNLSFKPACLRDLYRLFSFATSIEAGERLLIVTHSGTLRFLLVAMEGWRRLPVLLGRVNYCRPVVCNGKRCRDGVLAPLILFLTGIVLALALSPAPLPPLAPIAVASYFFALLVYGIFLHLGTRKYLMTATLLLIVASLLVGLSAFGPSNRDNRKQTLFNRWLYEQGKVLPTVLPNAPHPNGAAGALAPTLGLAIAAALSHRNKQRYLFLLLSSLLGILLLMTASRAGWLAAFTSLIILARQCRRRQLILLLLTLGIGGLVWMTHHPLPGQPSLLSVESLEMRWVQWRQSTVLLAERPIIGLGAGRFPPVYRQAVASTGGRAHKTPNNLLLELWADAGLLGLVAFGWLVMRTHRLCSRPLSDIDDPFNRYRLGLKMALVAFLVHGLFEANSVIIWPLRAEYVHLASPLPFALLGLLAGGYRSGDAEGLGEGWLIDSPAASARWKRLPGFGGM